MFLTHKNAMSTKQKTHAYEIKYPASSKNNAENTEKQLCNKKKHYVHNVYYIVRYRNEEPKHPLS